MAWQIPPSTVTTSGVAFNLDPAGNLFVSSGVIGSTDFHAIRSVLAAGPRIVVHGAVVVVNGMDSEGCCQTVVTMGSGGQVTGLTSDGVVILRHDDLVVNAGLIETLAPNGAALSL